MKFRPFIFAALLHGTTIGIAFSVMPVQSSSTGPADLGKIAVEHSVESTEPAQLPSREITPTERPAVTPAEVVPSFVAARAPEEPRNVETFPDPVDARPAPDQPEPMRPQPRFEVPRVVKPHPVTEAQRAATPVENAPNSGDSPDFTPGDLLEWEPPDSLLYKFRGTIIVIIELDASGKARSVSMQTGTGDDDIDQDVRVALIKGKYSAARDGDRAIATTLTRRFNILKPK